MKSLLELIRGDEPPPPPPPMDPKNAPAMTEAGSNISAAASAANKAQRTPARRPSTQTCAFCLSQKYSRVSIITPGRNILLLTLLQCDGQVPRCKPCADKDWPCFYMPDGPNGEPQIVVHEAPAPPVHANSLQQSAMALTLASANKDLQRELDQARNKLLDAQKEAFDLRSKLTDSEKQMDQLRAENTRLKNAAQVTINQPGATHDRRNTHQQQTVTIPPPPQPPGFHPHAQYPAPGNQLYHGQPAPSQGKSRHACIELGF
jgi:hypothetical protein